MSKLTPVFVDLETFWSPTHSLSKMNPVTYCTSKETEIISIAYKFDTDPAHCIFGEDKVKDWAKQVDWSDKLVVGHNLSLFDSMILRWRLGIKPAMWGCTLAMARPLHGLTVGGSLGKLVAHYGIGVKDQTALHNTKGRHLKDFTLEEIAAMREYNKADVDQCAGLFRLLLPKTPKQEMKIIDGTIRMLVEPKFRVDIPLLEKTLQEERAAKHQMLLETATLIGADTLGLSDDEIADTIAKTLGSSNKFAKLLQDLGVEPPMKISPTTGKEAYALAKTDDGFIELTTHQNPVVAAAANARLGVKSTILESRIQTFLEMAHCTGGRMPIAKNYYGAHTGRFSGAFAANQENLPRISGKRSDALRNCLIAPPGHKVVVADLSGIELRVNMYLWQVPYAMALFDADPEKADLYKTLASEVLGVPIEGMPKMVRQAGKAMHLGCGYGLGSAQKYISVARQMAGITVTEEEARQHIDGYRRKHPEIVAGWKACNDALTAIAMGTRAAVDPWGLIHTDQEGFVLPSGRKIRYPDLRKEANERGQTQWVFGEGRNKGKAYGGLCDENCIQGLARDILMDNALTIKKQTGLYPCHTVHDELIYVVPEADAQAMLDTVQAVMRTPPSWFPALKTWSEGDIADSYGGAK